MAALFFFTCFSFLLHDTGNLNTLECNADVS